MRKKISKWVYEATNGNYKYFDRKKAKLCDEFGMTPLMYCIIGGNGNDIITKFVELYPNGVYSRNFLYHNALEIMAITGLCKDFMRIYDVLYKRRQNAICEMLDSFFDSKERPDSEQVKREHVKRLNHYFSIRKDFINLVLDAYNTKKETEDEINLLQSEIDEKFGNVSRILAQEGKASKKDFEEIDVLKNRCDSLKCKKNITEKEIELIFIYAFMPFKYKLIRTVFPEHFDIAVGRRKVSIYIPEEKADEFVKNFENYPVSFNDSYIMNSGNDLILKRSINFGEFTTEKISTIYW
jgi:hypothetical protein